MVESRSLSIAVFVTFSTLASIRAQPTDCKIRVSEPETSRPDIKGSQCCRTALSEDSVPNALAGMGNVSSALQPDSSCVDVLQKSQRAGQFANERLSIWRQRLNLEDWQISIVMARRSELRPGTTGAIRWDKKKKAAVIWVLDASDYHLSFREMLDDMEFTVVHELIHLELASLPRSEASRSTEEHAVNRIAEALLRLDRQK